VATLIGYFGGALMLDLSRLVIASPSAAGDMPFILVSAVGLVLLHVSLPILFGLFALALLSDRLLERLRLYSPGPYAAAGALVGVAVGAVVIGWLFKDPWRGAACGPPVGALAGLAYWGLTRPQP
jgi:hypothetical protein